MNESKNVVLVNFDCSQNSLVMKLFEVILEYMAVVGFCPLQPGQKSKFNGRNVIVLVIYGICTISATAFFLCDAKTAREYEESFHAFNTVSLMFVGFLINLFQLKEIFKFVEKMERFCNSRKQPCF